MTKEEFLQVLNHEDATASYYTAAIPEGQNPYEWVTNYVNGDIFMTVLNGVAYVVCPDGVTLTAPGAVEVI